MLFVSYVAGEQLITSNSMKHMRHHCHPLLLIDLQEKTILYVLNKIVYANSDSGLLFIICGTVHLLLLFGIIIMAHKHE